MSSVGCRSTCIGDKEICTIIIVDGASSWECQAISPGERLSSGAIIGIVVGILFFIAIIICVLVVLRARKRRALGKGSNVTESSTTLRQSEDNHANIYGIQSIFTKTEVDHLAKGIYSDSENYKETHLSTKLSSRQRTIKKIPTIIGQAKAFGVYDKTHSGGFNINAALPQPGVEASTAPYLVDSLPVNQEDRFQNKIQDF